ncbi:conserved hypothetical protein [Sphingomonas sp. T1]|nr:hypothetical protein ASE82_18465 [Sphingomonas sp. Leaf230]VXD05994.1 conserved hypothetical protein [Sphingomonas sp. T1]
MNIGLAKSAFDMRFCRLLDGDFGMATSANPDCVQELAGQFLGAYSVSELLLANPLGGSVLGSLIQRSDGPRCRLTVIAAFLTALAACHDQSGFFSMSAEISLVGRRDQTTTT